MHHSLVVHEGSDAVDTAGVVIEVEKRAYRVLQPLFKNGKLYEKNSIIKLDPLTGERFVSNGDVQEVKK
jgi:hypothetical protein